MTANIRLIASATISGTVSGGGQPLTSGTVTVQRDGDFYGRYTAYLGAGGNYQAKGLPPGTYTLEFDAGAPWSYGYWKDAADLTTATHVSVSEGANVVLGDDSLAHSPAVAGTVHIGGAGGPTPLQSDQVTLTSVPYDYYKTKEAVTDAQGKFEIDGVTPGTYTLCFGSDEYVVPSCWNDKDTDHPTQFVVGAGDVLTGMDGIVEPAGAITATVQTKDPPDAPVALAGADVDLWRLDDAGTSYDFFRELTTDTGGGVSAEQLPVGTYRIEFRDPDGNYRSEWWDNQHYFGEPGEDIVITAGQTLDLGDVVLLPRDFDVTRTSGDDRFSGAVEMTKAIWPLPNDINPDGGVPAGGVPIIYIANGLNYPDALSAGPAAIVQQGALLLVLPTLIPDSVKAELTRLKPQQIVIVGGPASVSTAVEGQLHDYSSNVTRQTGADRFEASRNLAASVWGGPSGPGAPAVFISTGLNFPDALDAGPAAGLIDAPVILVNGSLPTLDPDTVQLLSDLGTINVFIAGGPGSVSPGIEAQLTDLMGANHLHRFTGDTRYEAAAAINAWFFPTTETAFLATGANFPDALAGAPLAGAVGGPIYLSQPGCIPQIVASQIHSGDTQQIWLLGGPASISPAVEDLTLCAS